MTPIPQSPWTLAIAELLGLHLAALDSASQPADLLANLLPHRDPLPDGWLASFLAGTPVPGLSAPSNSNQLPKAPGLDSFLDSFGSLSQNGAQPNDSAADPSPLESLIGAAQSGTSPTLPDNRSIASGYEQAQRVLQAGGSKVDVSGILNALYPTLSPNGRTGSQRPSGRATARAAGTPPFTPKSAAAGSDSPLGSLARTLGDAAGSISAAQITVQFDFRKFVEELKLLAKLEAERVVNHREVIYAAQLKGSGKW
jgi:hypothetical protein